MGAGRQSRGRVSVSERGRSGVCEAKSGLHRAACRLTAGGAGSKPVLRISATENIPPADLRIRR